MSDLDGHFGIVAYDHSKSTVTAASDPFAMQSMYVAERDGRTYVSSSALTLAKHLRAQPDMLALCAFLRAGYHFGTMTNWAGIDRLNPGTCITFTSEGSSRRIYWRPAIDRRVARLDLDAAIDHCIDVSVDTYRRHLAGESRAWSDLTGGYDSRLLNLLLRKAGVDFDTTTRDTPDVRDVELAERIARLAGWHWLHTSLPPDWDEALPRWLDKAVAWGEANLEVLQLSRVLWAHEQLSRRHHVLLSAGGGEHFQYAAWKSEFLDAGKSSRVKWDNWAVMRLLKPVNVSVLANDPSAEVQRNFVDRMKAWVEPYAAELNTTQLDILFAYKMTGHCGAYGSADGAHLHAGYPIYLKPIFEAVFSTNFRIRNQHRLQRSMIERLDPRLAAVQTTRGGPAQRPRVGNMHKFAPYYLVLGRKGINKVSQKALGRTLLAPAPGIFPWEHTATNNVLDHLGREQPFEYANMRSAPLFDPSALDDFLERARDPDFTETDLLGRIITVELAMRAAGAELSS
jgi:hypothetical protein